MNPEDAIRWRSAGLLALSPDGKQIAFVEMWSDPDKNENRSAVFVVPADGSRPARQITFGPKRDSNPKWSPDGTKLAFVSARETEWRPDLYVLDMRGGDAQLAVTLPRGVSDYAWSKDGSRFALLGLPAYPDDRFRPTEDEEERRKRYAERAVYTDRMHYRADGNRLVDDEFAWVWVASPGEDARVVLENDKPINSVGWLPDGRVGFLSSRGDDHELTWNSQLWAVSEKGSLEQISDSVGAVNGYAFTDGGSVVTWAYPVPGFTIGCHDDRLFVDGKRVCADLGMNIGKHVLSDTIDPVSRSSTPTTDGGDIYFAASHHGAVGVYRNDGEPVVGGHRVVGEFCVANGVIAFTSTSPDDPASIRVAKIDGTDERVVHEPNPWLTDRREWYELWVEVDGVRSQAWLLSPVHQRASGAPPCVLNIHGGPHGAYGWAYNFLVQVQSAPEWALIIGNPPGSLTYGEAFAQLTHKAWGEADFPHVMAYCDEAVKQGLADEDKLAIAGGSYGGFLTTWAIGHTDRFKAACAQRPPTKLDSIFGSSEFGWALMHSCFGVHPWEDPELYRRLSPVTYAERINTPLRLIGCTEDYRVPMEQVEQLYITLKVLGRPVDLVVFRESHHLVYGGKPWSRAGHAQAVREWLERYL